jgi:hypothetical protein
MTPREQRNERLGTKLVRQLEQRHYEAYYCATASEAVAKVLTLIPEGSTIS